MAQCSSICHTHVSGHWVHTHWIDINVTQTQPPRPHREGRHGRDPPQWAPAAGWWCVASLVSVGSCPGPQASPSLALSACTAAVYRCISSASPAGSNREHSTDGRGRLVGDWQHARSYSWGADRSLRRISVSPLWWYLCFIVSAVAHTISHSLELWHRSCWLLWLLQKWPQVGQSPLYIHHISWQATICFPYSKYNKG